MATRIFTCNQEGYPYPEVQKHINEAKKQLAAGKRYGRGWSCSTINTVQVGDRAYFYRVASEPTGFFACGRVVSEKPSFQLGKTSHLDHLSSAYSNQYTNEEYVVAYEWLSVVDYDKTLSGRKLRAIPEFDDYKFLFRRSGQSLGESFTAKHLQLLDELWIEHVIEMAKGGYGACTPLLTT